LRSRDCLGLDLGSAVSDRNPVIALVWHSFLGPPVLVIDL